MRIAAPLSRSAAVLAAASLCLLALGCGSGKSLPGNDKPAAFNESRFRPNYGSDLYAAFYWPATTVRYRILNAGTSTAINPANTISVQQPSGTQAQDIHDAFAKWQNALAGGDAIGVRQFVEVDPSDTSANIDVAVQSPSDFDGEDTAVKEQTGATDTYTLSKSDGTMGRAIIRLRGDSDERTFRYTALHEAGHALGLFAHGSDGHSRHYGDVMYAIQPLVIPVIDLQEYDINTIRANYSRPATD